MAAEIVSLEIDVNYKYKKYDTIFTNCASIFADRFKEEYGNNPWPIYVIVDSPLRGKITHVVAKRIFVKNPRKIYFGNPTEHILKKDQAVFIYGARLSYFDEDDFKDKYIPIIRATNRKKLVSKIKKANRKRRKKMSRKIFRKGRNMMVQSKIIVTDNSKLLQVKGNLY